MVSLFKSCCQKTSAPTEEHASDDSMSIIPCRVCYIAEAQHIQLGVPPATCGMNRKKNRPCYQTTYEAEGTEYSKEAKKKISIHRRTVKNMGVGDFYELSKPVQKARWQLRTPFTIQVCSVYHHELVWKRINSLFVPAVQMCPRSVPALLGPSTDNE